MNGPIIRLFGVVLVLFGGLLGATSWWTVVKAEDTADNPLNARDELEQLRVRRGTIRADDRTVLARSVQAEQDTFRRRYSEEATLVAHAVGYWDLERGSYGLERFRDDALAGRDDALGSLFKELQGERRVGDNVITNLDLNAQRVALQALGGRRGAVVALEPDTGAVKVMASVPGFDPSVVDDPDAFAALDDGELVNRVTRGGYAPGSTFKVVTAVAALDSGDYQPNSTLDGSSPQTISGVPLRNFGGQDYGPVTLTQALTNSINTVWAQVGVDLGEETMGEYMRRFGFYDEPPIDYPDEQLLASGVYEDGELLPADSGEVDVGRLAIGQERLRVTPLQMGMVAAAVANDGVLMRPLLTRNIVDRDGRAVEDVEPERVRRVMSRQTARQVTQMMTNVVNEGSGTAGALQGVDVAGKTGTAERNVEQDINQPWFIAFAPAPDPEIAIAVTVEESQGGQGGTVAAPIARQVLEALTD